MGLSSRTQWVRFFQKPSVIMLVACLVLGGYLGFLLFTNFKNQMALRASSLERIQLNLEKHAASLQYFFSERKHDLTFIANSTEVTGYFVNKSLGMSEAYGLKVNRFMIGQMFRTTIQSKLVQNDTIYDRFILRDLAGETIVDTAHPDKVNAKLLGTKESSSLATDAVVLTSQDTSGSHVFLKANCFFKGKQTGELYAFLNFDTVVEHFVNTSPEIEHIAFAIINSDGTFASSIVESSSLDIYNLTSKDIDQLPENAFTEIALALSPQKSKAMMVAHTKIHNAPLRLLSWVDKDAIISSSAPWQLLLGTGTLAMVILFGLFRIIQFNTKNLILEAYIAEANRQQNTLALKNQQLNNEIMLRQEVESELEKQRTVQVRSDRLRSLGEMAAGIAHELNQPLVGVRGMAELLLLTLEHKGSVSKDALEKKIHTIVEQSDRMVHIIDHVRLFARDAGKVQTSQEDLNAIVTSALSLISAQFRSHELYLEKTLYNGTLPVEVNPLSVEEVIFNLLSNAKDALESKKKVASDLFVPKISIVTGQKCSVTNSLAWVEIQDNANGISEETAKNIFDPFFTTKAPDKGTGLGLSISKSIVEEFDGEISFNTQESEGTIFTITFPMMPYPAKRENNATNE